MTRDPEPPPVLLVKRLHHRAVVPAYQTAGAAGLDLAACLPEGPVELGVNQAFMVPTGIAIAIPEGHEGQVRARSGLASRHGVIVPNAPGTIDCDYRGELKVALRNVGSEAITIEHAMRVAQLVIAPVTRAEVRSVDDLDTTARGAGGFGSTGLV